MNWVVTDWSLQSEHGQVVSIVSGGGEWLPIVLKLANGIGEGLVLVFLMLSGCLDLGQSHD